MEIHHHTKISEIIKADKAAIDAIASVARPLERLKNPILRKIMASRVTLAEAAKMGGTTVNALAAALAPLGFTFKVTAEMQNEVKEAPHWLKNAAKDALIFFDVRPVIENGTDPLKDILHRFKEVPDGHILCIINTFVPTPLIHLLEKEKAEASYVEAISPKEFHTYFLKKGTAVPAAKTGEKIIMDAAADFEHIHQRFSKENIREIDVRALEMPGPMQAILTELETLAEGEMLYIHHKRVPVYLLEELADKHFEVHIYTIEEGNVKMIIFKPHG